ncbi:hypothetical protein HQQ82_10445 [Rathayibacter sp. VKM Ac-2856]|uniref:hypothetical protein n=1 Tax=unclassified Rathayibacter TaxID=2609250 RepID=UPI0015646F82|nr:MULTISPECIES: hypothetical protein [unclassified Rathayibacter]NQX05221.1 hypothetical protein [Rathayibacter sp. VKM Ac-2858]NQX20388.1 hypothetical protein [Rathayibacter sp. VKM Ac-2856]
MPRRRTLPTIALAALLAVSTALPAHAATTGPSPLDDPLAGVTTEALRVLPADPEAGRPAAVYTIVDERYIAFPVSATQPGGPGTAYDLLTAAPLSAVTDVARGRTALLPCSRVDDAPPSVPAVFATLCRAAGAAEMTWRDGRSLGVPIWYARDLDGELVCISGTGAECLTSEPGIDPAAGADRWRVSSARCSSAPAGSPLLLACGQLRTALNDSGHRIAQRAHERQYARMDRLFSLGPNDARVGAEAALSARVAEFAPRLNRAIAERRTACHPAWMILNIFVSIGLCTAAAQDVKTLEAERDAVTNERDARVGEAQAGLRARMAEDWHELHRTWAGEDPTGFAALLRVESKELSELKATEEEYRRAAESDEQEFLALQRQWLHERSVVGEAEKIPLIGPMIRHIEDYEENPSGINLRRIFLGALGPVGETIEGGLELSAETALKSGELRFLSDALHEIGGQDDFGTTLENLAADFTKDLGDEAVEGVRESGLWSEAPGSDAPPESQYQDFGQLLARSPRMTPDATSKWLLASGPLNDKLGIDGTKRLPVLSATSADLRLAAGQVAFERGVEAVFTHAFGTDYEQVARKNPAWTGAEARLITAELLKVVTDSAYLEQISPMWVASDTLGDRPAAFVYDDDQSVILLNKDRTSLTDGSANPEFAKYYLEELGHSLNWWRCQIFDVEVKYCEVPGDAGARFRDAVMLSTPATDPGFGAAVAELPAHDQESTALVRFSGGSTAHLEGWNSYSSLNSHISGKGRFSFLLRAGIELSSEYPGVSDEFDLEMSVGAPSMTRNGNPWITSPNGTCEVRQLAAKEDCNVPTMSIAFSFRDSINYSLLGAPRVRDSRLASAGVNLSPAIVRKHGVRLYFQPKPGEPDAWRFLPGHSIYFKEFSLAADGKIDGTKMLDTFAGKRMPAPHRIDVAGKATVEGSYIVEIATREKSALDRWLALDVSSALLGCAGGVVFAVVAEQDPITGCHVGSDLIEGVESAIEAEDRRLTSFLTSNASVAVPLSVEYKATRPAGRVTELPADTPPPQPGAVEMWEVGPPPAASAHSAQQVSALKAKASTALKKMKSVSFTGLAVFRPRISWTLATRSLHLGTHSLPTANLIE